MGVATTLERIIEAALFLSPFLAFAAWRLLLSSVVPPLTLVVATAVITAGLLSALLWLHQSEAENAGRAYIPARIEDGRFIPGHAAP